MQNFFTGRFPNNLMVNAICSILVENIANKQAITDK